MKTLIGALGNSAVVLWNGTPAWVKFPVITLGVVFALAETNIDLQHALQASRIFGGQAAQLESQGDDAQKTRAALKNGTPVTNAAALLGAQINQGDATAKNTYATVPQTQALSDAATESIETIMDKERRHQPVNSTEQMRLVEYENAVYMAEKTKAERDKMMADAVTAQNNATASASKARADNAVNNTLANAFGPSGDISANYDAAGAFDRLISPPTPNRPQQDFAGMAFGSQDAAAGKKRKPAKKPPPDMADQFMDQSMREGGLLPPNQ
jgi:hypothetical protein